ncbi:MAG: site-specific integrase [Acidocella sp.]|nr:site-specific integrase [Acidocella sp.]
MIESNQWPEEIGERNRKSFNVYRAALVFCAKETIRNRYARITDEGDIISRVDAAYLVKDIEHSLAILNRYPPHGGGTACQWSAPDEGQTKKGKRRGISKLPENWRERMAQACPTTSRYAAALYLSALVGLRPQELKYGAIVGVVDGHIAVWIEGAKVTTKNGQPARSIAFLIDNVIARMLANIVVAKKTERGKLKVSIKDPRKFCDVVRSLSRTVFPEVDYIVTPYSFRHGFAADQKARKVDPADLAKALGHVSARSQRAYGSTGQGRRPLIALTQVIATRPVRALDRATDYMAWQDSKQDSALGMQPGY